MYRCKDSVFVSIGYQVDMFAPCRSYVGQVLGYGVHGIEANGSEVALG